MKISRRLALKTTAQLAAVFAAGISIPNIAKASTEPRGTAYVLFLSHVKWIEGEPYAAPDRGYYVGGYVALEEAENKVREIYNTRRGESEETLFVAELERIIDDDDVKRFRYQYVTKGWMLTRHEIELTINKVEF